MRGGSAGSGRQTQDCTILSDDESRLERPLTIIIQNPLSGCEICTSTVSPSELVIDLKQSVKAVQDVPEITLMNSRGEFLNPVQSVRDVGLKDGDVVFAVLMAHRLVATASADGRIKIWDTENNQVERETRAAPPRSLLAACFSADGHRLVTGSAVGTPKLWDAKTGLLRAKFESHSGSVSCVDVASHGRWVVSGAYDFLVKVWDVETGSCIKHLVDPELQQEEPGMPQRSHLLHLNAVKFSPYDSNIVATASEDCTAKLWSVQSGERLHRLRHLADPQGPHPVTSLCFTFNGKEVVTTSDCYATLWHVETGVEMRTWEAHTSQVTSSAHSIEESLLLTGSKDGTAKLWDLQSGLCRRTLQGHEGPVTAVALSPDSKFAVTGSADGQAKVWNTLTGNCEQTLEGNKLAILMATFVPC